jgi:hypothetical protein
MTGPMGNGSLKTGSFVQYVEAAEFPEKFYCFAKLQVITSEKTVILVQILCLWTLFISLF